MLNRIPTGGLQLPISTASAKRRLGKSSILTKCLHGYLCRRVDVMYKASEVEKLDPAKFHYYPRDARRNQPPIQTILNPSAQEGLLPSQTLEAIEGYPALDSATEVSPMIEGVRPPTRKYKYRA